MSVNFHLPYRCKYGQKLCLIGSNDMLGSWHVDRAVAMNWTEVRSGPWPALSAACCCFNELHQAAVHAGLDRGCGLQAAGPAAATCALHNVQGDVWTVELQVPAK